MSKPADMTLADMHDDPCSRCFVCNFKHTEYDCYQGNLAQCATCALIQSIVEQAWKEYPQHD